jgi:hypothetical protein
MFGAFRYMINARGCSFDLLGHLVTAHLFMPCFMCVQSKYCLGLLSWSCMCFMLLVKMARLLV